MTTFGRNMVEITRKSRIFWRKPSISTMYRLVYSLVYFFLENYTETRSCWNFNPSAMFWSQNCSKWHKNTPQCQNRPETVQIGRTFDPVEKNLSPKNLEFSWKNPDRQLDLLVSILARQSRSRTLYLSPAPPAHNASVSSRYPGLWDRFWSYFSPQSPYEILEIHTRARSLTLRSSTAVRCCHEFLSWMDANGWIGSLRPKSSPRVTETVQKWVLWIKNCSQPWYGHLSVRSVCILPVDLWIYRESRTSCSNKCPKIVHQADWGVQWPHSVGIWSKFQENPEIFDEIYQS